MDEKRVADYFVVAGLPEDPVAIDENSDGNICSLVGHAPITEIGVIFPALGETLPEDYEVITKTPTGLSANLNHGSLRTLEIFLVYKRGRDKPPLVDIGVIYEGKESLMADAEKVTESVGGNVANVNNSSSQTFLTFRRENASMPCNSLVVTDICVVIASKGESPPHAFCCINKNLNKGILGSDVYLCYKKSMNRPKLITYKPEVLFRYPMIDLPKFTFPDSVPLFCLPMGATLELWPKKAVQPHPVLSTFVLTVSDAKYKVYGSAVTFYESYSVDELTENQRELLEYDDEENYDLHVNKSICLLSHWPFSDAFHHWLRFLHERVASGQIQSIPVERYIAQLLNEVPFPAPRTLLQLSIQPSCRVIMTQPEDLPLPKSAANFRQLLLNLQPENCLQVLLLALTEQKILIHSLRPDILTAVAEAVSSFLFPFKWQCPYIPLCPLGLVEVLNAPLPFLIGVDSRFFNLYDPPTDVSCVDLDTNIITIAESQRQLLGTKLLPKRAAKLLKTSLEHLYYKIKIDRPSENNEDDDMEVEFQKRRKEQSVELEIQEAFLKFMVITLKGYRTYLRPITKAPTIGTTDPQALFHLSEFLKSRDKSHHKFFNLLMKTQMFIRFIEERSFVADGDHGLAFFDECTERMSFEEGDMRLIEYDGVHKNDRTIFVLPPEAIPGDGIFYKSFSLNPLLFKSKRNHVSALQNQNIMPGSPMTKRTKHEIKSAQKLARKYYTTPHLWAKCLCGTCHTLYFMILPSLLHLSEGKETATLQEAFELLVRATELKLLCDEVCYRLMMQLCGEYSRPLLAVKLLVHMRKYGIQPNALTYGLYNRCVLEAEWSAYAGSRQLWNKLRNVVVGAAHFKRAIKRKSMAHLSASTEGSSSLLDSRDRATSHSSLDSHEAIQVDGILEKFKKSIFRGSLNGSQQSVAEIVDGPEAEVEDDIVKLQKEQKLLKETLKNNHFTPPESPLESRLLSRSESGGDANILDKLQQSKKNCSRTLQFNREEDVDVSESSRNSPSKVSPRTAVTENDPLGAFIEPLIPQTTLTPPEEISNQSKTLPPNLHLLEDPVLFRSAVHKSATFEGSPPSQGKIHRSETVPAATVSSSLASIGSSIKFGLSRYSPSRLSLRKPDLKGPQQFIENALTTFSPGSLAGKKSNELLQGGLSSIRLAASSMAKKLDEIKEAISTTSATSTPNKVLTVDRLGAGDMTEGDCDSNDGSEGGERIRRISAELGGSYRGSCTNLKEYDDRLPECLFTAPKEDLPPSEVDITITSCSQCHNCSALLYDEDIMAHWFAEDSNLNTICQACSNPTVPFLTINITGPDITNCDPFSIPYLNPLVLRKELENILSQESDLCTADPKFIDDHPIIYWNLIWAFERINVQTHLSSLYLKGRMKSDKSSPINTACVKPNGICKEEKEDGQEKEGVEDEQDENGGNMTLVEAGTDPLTQELEQLTAPVNVKCLWDQPRLHGDLLPMYILWDHRSLLPVTLSEDFPITKSLMQKIISSVRLNDLAEPLKTLAKEREKLHKNESKKHIFSTHSIYRDILFLACKVVGRTKVDLNEFDKVYLGAYSRVTDTHNKLYGPQDRPLNIMSLYCRQYFKPLSLP